MPRPAQLCPPTHLIPRLSCLSWCVPSSLDLGEGHEVSLTGASCSKVPLPRSSSETQAAAFPAPPSALSSSEALVLNPSLFQMWQHLTKAEAKLLPLDSGGRHELSESVYTDVLDQSCSQKWQG